MSLNINDITTVSDLLKAQDDSSDDGASRTDELTQLILDEDPSLGLELACRIITALREFHAKGVDLQIAKGQADHSAQWASDYTRLDAAYELIKEIQL